MEKDGSPGDLTVSPLRLSVDPRTSLSNLRRSIFSVGKGMDLV